MESKTTKTILIILGVLMLCCCVVVGGGYWALTSGFEYFADSMIVDDPAQIQEAADELADYQLPVGYQEEFVMDILGFKALFITHSSKNSVIMLMQFNESLFGDVDQARQQFQDTFLQQFQGESIQFTPVGQEQVVIRGQETTLFIYEGSDSAGTDYEQWVSVFNGKNGTVMLMVYGAVGSLDQAELFSFLDSID
ncbi:MAG: hypothetical protein ABFS17_08765 [Chloroflexota bacterium]